MPDIPQVVKEQLPGEAWMMDLLEMSPALICVLDGPDLVVRMVNKSCRCLFNVENPIGHRLSDLLPDERNRAFMDLVVDVCRTRQSRASEEAPLFLSLRSAEGVQARYFSLFVQPVPVWPDSQSAIVIQAVDLTSQVAARETAAAENERFRIAGEAIPYGVWEADVNGGIVYVGRKMLELIGVPLEAVCGNKWQRFIHPDDLAPLAYRVSTTMPRGEPFEDEFRILGVDGQYHYVLSKGRPVRDREGRLTSWVGLHLDINEAKEQEKALQESERRFRLLAESSPVIIWSASPTGNLDYVNQRWREATGRSDEETLGARWLDAVHVEDAPRIVKLWTESIRARKPFVMECRIQIRDGRYRWMFAHAQPVLDEVGNLQKWLGVGVDITERKDAEIELRRAQENLTLALAAGQMVTWEMNARQELLVTGGHPYPLVGREVTSRITVPGFLTIVHPDDRSRVAMGFQSLMARADQAEFDMEFRVVWPNGSIHWLTSRARATSCEDIEGAVVSRGVLVDVTKLKVAEQSLLRAKDAAESANRLKTSFLANMSHEIRTPLGVIIGFSELLAGSGLSPQEKERFRATILRSGQELTRLIDDILDLSKVEAGYMEIVTATVSLEEMLREIEELMGARAKQGGVSLEIRVEGGLPKEIGTDPIRLKQILFNLIGNAIKFTPRGGVSVVVRCEETGPSGGVLRFEVSDSGVGLSPSEQQKIFHPFVQADSSMKRTYGGTGLGLALSKKIANAMGGDVHLIRSSPNHGSVFGVRIPFVAPPMAPTANVDRENEDKVSLVSDGRLAGLKVLLVEDSKDNQDLMTRILSRDGAIMEVADNGREGVEKALRSPHDLVLMDIQMPVMDGNEAMQKLKGSGFETPVIALTAHAMREEREKSLRLGFADYVTKPVTRATLIETLARHANRS